MFCFMSWFKLVSHKKIPIGKRSPIWKFYYSGAGGSVQLVTRIRWIWVIYFRLIMTFLLRIMFLGPSPPVMFENNEMFGFKLVSFLHICHIMISERFWCNVDIENWHVRQQKSEEVDAEIFISLFSLILHLWPSGASPASSRIQSQWGCRSRHRSYVFFSHCWFIKITVHLHTYIATNMPLDRIT